MATAHAVLALAREDTGGEVLGAVARLAGVLPPGDEAANHAIYGAWVRNNSRVFDQLIADPARRPGLDTLRLFAQVLGQSRHHRLAQCSAILRALSPTADAEAIEALWALFADAPSPALAGVLAELGWPAGRAVPTKLARDLLALAGEDTDQALMRAVVALAAALPVADEAGNDAIYAAWVRSQSPELESLIARQGREAATPTLEALHALVSGDLQGYAALHDQDGTLLVQAFAMAPEPLRQRLARTVANSPDRGIKDAYRRALQSGALDPAQRVENLKLVGDEDGLFEQTRHLRLWDLLALCERWAQGPSRPTPPDHRAVVEQAVAAYRGLGAFQVDPGPKLPDGMVDLFDHWRGERPADDDLRADLGAEDPFRKARGLYLGYERGLVDAPRLAAAAGSDHWPERLMARLIAPGLDPAAGARDDHVLWVNACAGDAALLGTPVLGTPEDYTRHSERLKEAAGPAAARTRALLSVLCAFQGVYVASKGEWTEVTAPDRPDIPELEEAGEVEF